MIKKQKIDAFAPATVANVGCGFDVFGLALNEPGDEISLQISEKPGVRIKSISGDNGKLPLEAQENTCSVSLHAMLDDIGADFGVDLALRKKMSIGSGLGSSAASSVVSIFALNNMLKTPLSNKELLKYAIAGEKISSGENVHLDNIAACLYGGFILVRSSDPIDIVQLPVPENLYCSVLHPQIEIRTELTRRMLRKNIPLSQAVRQWSNVAGTICALYTSDFELLERSFEDTIVVPDRAELIPRYYEMRSAALEHGAIGFSISGSGPSVFALSNSPTIARTVGQAMQRCMNGLDIESDLYISNINSDGPRIIR